MGKKGFTNGGKRRGAGRPKGSRSPHTIERDLALKHMRARVVEATDHLLTSQMAVAHGLTFLYVIKTVKGKRQKPRVVKDQATIEMYLADELINSRDEYFFMATERPNTAAIDSLFDRTYGRSVQTLNDDDDKDDSRTIIIVRNGKGN